ncbi:MAG: glycosyl hydrolase family 8 [Sarcina sp.]
MKKHKLIFGVSGIVILLMSRAILPKLSNERKKIIENKKSVYKEKEDKSKDKKKENENQEKKEKMNLDKKSESTNEYKNSLIEFIDDKMSNRYGVYTNYLDESSQENDITTGHNILSESHGLMMLYSINADDKERFNKSFNTVKNNMLMENGLVVWRIDKDGIQKDTTNAIIDDLRIAKALLYGYDKWKNEDYKRLALEIGNALKEYCVGVDGYLRDFYDTEYNVTNEKVDICYIDIAAMKKLAEHDSEWNEIIKKNRKLIDGAYVSDELPLYHKEYYYDTKKYVDMKNEKGKVFIDTTTSVVTVLNKSEAGEDVSSFIKWANKQITEKGFIVGAYNKDGSAASNIESTAIYSTVAIIAKEQGETQLMNKCFEKLKEFQLNDIGWNNAGIDEELYGAFGDKTNQSVFSFDNLYALNAYAYMK